MKSLLTIAVLSVVISQAAAAQADNATREKVRAALQLEYRTDADRARDRNRRALRAIEFMGLTDDMRVYEFGPGNGWYTKILAPVLKDKGELIIAYRKEWLADVEGLSEPEMDRVKQIELDMDWDEENLVYTFDGMDLQASKLDMFLNIRGYHNLHGEERMEFNQAVFDALNPGGTYVVIDHTRRHMQPDNSENWRREDPIKVLVEIQQAGFELEKWSDMFYRPDDSLEYEVGRKTVTGNTDRFFYVFKKPE